MCSTEYLHQCLLYFWCCRIANSPTKSTGKENSEVDYNNDDEDQSTDGAANDDAVVYDMARALMQIYQGMEAKYLSPPLGKLCILSTPGTCIMTRLLFRL